MARDDPFSVSGDLHGLMGGAPPEIRPTGDIAAWYQKLCISSSGVFYEDTYLQASTPLQLKIRKPQKCARQRCTLSHAIPNQTQQVHVLL